MKKIIAGKNWSDRDDLEILIPFWCPEIIKNLDAILEARYGSLSGHRKQRRSRTAFSAQQLQALERAFETTQVNIFFLENNILFYYT